MAKVRGPFYSRSASGSVGDRLTAKHGRRHDHIVTWSKPTDGRTPDQLAVRACISPVLALWRDLNGLETGEWILWVRQHRLRMAAYQLFMQVNLPRQLAGQGLLRIPGGAPTPASAWEVDPAGGLENRLPLLDALFGLWDALTAGEISPAGGSSPDLFWELDGSGGIMPLAA